MVKKKNPHAKKAAHCCAASLVSLKYIRRENEKSYVFVVWLYNTMIHSYFQFFY